LLSFGVAHSHVNHRLSDALPEHAQRQDHHHHHHDDSAAAAAADATTTSNGTTGGSTGGSAGDSRSAASAGRGASDDLARASVLQQDVSDASLASVPLLVGLPMPITLDALTPQSQAQLRGLLSEYVGMAGAAVAAHMMLKLQD
jgi:hypothetical protein